MANLIAIGGNSGSGKSSSLRNLRPEETFIISVTGKDLPFKGFKKKFTLLKKVENNYVGNLYNSKNYHDIIQVLNIVSFKMPKIKQLVIDDANYLMSFEAMERAEEKGWDELLSLSI